MKKIILIIITVLFLSINYVDARDIQPVSHNQFGETEWAIDLDSVKKVSDNIFSVEVLNLTSKYTSKDEISIIKQEINATTKQTRVIEVYSRNRKSWKISSSFSNAMIVEAGMGNWKNIEKSSTFESIYLITYIIGLKGKKYYIDSLYKSVN